MFLKYEGNNGWESDDQHILELNPGEIKWIEMSDEIKSSDYDSLFQKNPALMIWNFDNEKLTELPQSMINVRSDDIH